MNRTLLLAVPVAATAAMAVAAWAATRTEPELYLDLASVERFAVPPEELVAQPLQLVVTNDSDDHKDEEGAWPVDVNRATVEQLCALPHITHERAHDLVAQRPFASTDELTRVRGLGQMRVNDLVSDGLVTV